MRAYGEVLARAYDAVLITVLAWELPGGEHALARIAFSRVSRYCLAHAQCPVLAIPPPTLARELAHGRLAWTFWHRDSGPGTGDDQAIGSNLITRREPDLPAITAGDLQAGHDSGDNLHPAWRPRLLARKSPEPGDGRSP